MFLRICFSVLVAHLLGLQKAQCHPTMDEMIKSAMISKSRSMKMDSKTDEEDTVLTELDILYTHDDYDRLMENSRTPRRTPAGRKKRATNTNLWPNGVVPYGIASKTFSSRDMQIINEAFGDWNRYTCLQFREKTSSDQNFIRLRGGGGCASYVGMQTSKKAQDVQLGYGCIYKKGTVIHELGHAIGFQHEQTRPDRDTYVHVVTANIQDGFEKNFRKIDMDTNGVPYDYDSLMHYGKNFLSANGRNTIMTVDPSKQNVIGNRDGLSFLDIKRANIIYNCNAHCPTTTCSGEDAFVGKDCKCWCSGNPVQECS